MLKVKLILLFLLVIGWFFLTFRILEVPPGINGDEAAIGYNAALVSRTEHDQSGRFLPLFISAFNLTDWKQPITFYSTVLSFKLFGVSYFNLRAVSVVIILISSLIIFALNTEILGTKAGFVSLFIFLTIPAVIIQSHLALENIAPVPFIAGWLLSFVKYKKTLQLKYLILGAVCLGLSLFSYPGMRLIFPVMSILSLGFVWFLNKNQFIVLRKHLVVFFLILIPFPIFMYSLKNVYPGAILAYNRPQAISSYQEFFNTYLSAFDWSFLFLKGDATPYHSTGMQGVFLLASLPLFVTGIIKIFRQKDVMQIFVLLAFFLTPIFYGFTGTGSIYRSSRMLAFLSAFTVITSIGFMTLANLKHKKKYVILFIISAIFLLNFLDFIGDYWYKYPLRVQSQFSKPMQLVFKKAFELSKQEHLKVYITDDFSSENEIATDFFEYAYFPEGLSKFKAGDGLPMNSILIAGSKDPADPNQKLQRYDVGTEFFSIFVNK